MDMKKGQLKFLWQNKEDSLRNVNFHMIYIAGQGDWGKQLATYLTILSE